MKQLAVRSLGWCVGGWSIGAIALIQLPVQASNLTSSAVLPATVQTAEELAMQPTQRLIAVTLNSRSLRQGDQGADVRALQRYLARNGLYSFEIDGFYGQDTANAVATYQRIRDLSATGIADEATLADMDFDFQPVAPATAVTPSSSTGRRASSLLGRNLALGSTGSDVIALQQRLNNFGIPVFVDGVYGFETEQGVRTYQRVQDLNVTGVADAQTLEAMGFSAPSYPYVAAVIADEARLTDVRQYFPDAFVDRDRRGRFINIGSFAERLPAEARVDAAAARGFTTRVLYR
ncbi:MAG: peptidoglycan-binding protein [Phormidesmis sp.]